MLLGASQQARASIKLVSAPIVPVMPAPGARPVPTPRSAPMEDRSTVPATMVPAAAMPPWAEPVRLCRSVGSNKAERRQGKCACHSAPGENGQGVLSVYGVVPHS